MIKEHRYLILYLIAIFLTIILYYLGVLEALDSFLRPFGYLGVFILGFLYTSAFTTPFATGALLLLNGGINPVLGGFVGAIGSVLYDSYVYKIFESEIGKKFNIGQRSYKIKRIKNKFLLRISPFLAFLIIAIPIPDELAAVLLGLEKYNLRRFAIVSFFANSFGIFLLLYLGLNI